MKKVIRRYRTEEDVVLVPGMILETHWTRTLTVMNVVCLHPLDSERLLIHAMDDPEDVMTASTIPVGTTLRQLKEDILSTDVEIKVIL